MLLCNSKLHAILAPTSYAQIKKAMAHGADNTVCDKVIWSYAQQCHTGQLCAGICSEEQPNGQLGLAAMPKTDSGWCPCIACKHVS